MALRSNWRPDKEEVVAENGIVTAMEPEPAAAGLEILKRGGNAIDAAVAIGFCNVVREPYMATIAGMGYMLIHLAAEGRTVAIDFNTRAPRAARPDMYRVIGPAPAGGYDIFQVEDDANNRGPQCVTVPATCAGLLEAHKRFGRLPRETVLEPAISLAEDGFEANWYLTVLTANKFDDFAADPYLAGMWLPGGRVPVSQPKPGQRIVQRDLGDLLRRVARDGADALHRGEVAAAIEEFMRTNGGLLTRDDLEEYEPRVSEPLSAQFRGHTVMAVPTPSGTITNLQTLGVLDRLDFARGGHNSPEHLHLLLQAARHAFADRYRYLGDWEHEAVPLEGLLSPEYARELAGGINRSEADIGVDNEDEPWVHYMERAIHDPWKHDPSPAPAATPRAAMDTNDEDTTHINVVDRDRNAVLCTHTGTFTPGANPPGTGVYLVGGMGWFIPKPGYANSIAGWKRPLNNMSPVMVFRDGRPVLCQGAPGSRRIMNRGVQVMSNVVVFGMTPQEAINAPVVDASSRETLVDSRIPEETVSELRRRGHRITVVEQEPGLETSFSRPSAIAIDYDRGLLRAGVDPFRPAMALGY